MQKVLGIYSITHTESGRTYIGSSKNISRRLSTHKLDLKKNKHTNPALQNHYNKYGLVAFSFNILTVVEDIETLIDIENEFIAEFGGRNLDQSKIFNTQWAGKTGCVDPNKIKRGKDHHLFGKVSPNKDKIFSDVVRANMSAGQTGKKYINRKVQSQESRDRMAVTKRVAWSISRRKAYEDSKK